jgi:hypothetical protein
MSFKNPPPQDSPPTTTTTVDITEIERQWALFRRKNAKASERIAAEELHEQRRREEEKRIQKAYEEYMYSETEYDKQQKRQKTLKRTMNLISGTGGGGVSGTNNNNNNANLPPPMLLLSGADDDDDEANNNSSTKLGMSYASTPTANNSNNNTRTTSNNSPAINIINQQQDSKRATPVQQQQQSQQQQQRPRSQSSAVNNTSRNAQQRDPSDFLYNLANDPQLQKAVRLIERKVRLFLQNKQAAERRIEESRAAADAVSDKYVSGWRHEVWVRSQMMRPRFQLSSDVVASIELQRRAAEGRMRALEQTNIAAELHERQLTPGNRNWIHNHLLRSADRFEKRKNKPVATTLSRRI